MRMPTDFSSIGIDQMFQERSKTRHLYDAAIRYLLLDDFVTFLSSRFARWNNHGCSLLVVLVALVKSQAVSYISSRWFSSCGKISYRFFCSNNSKRKSVRFFRFAGRCIEVISIVVVIIFALLVLL